MTLPRLFYDIFVNVMLLLILKYIIRNEIKVFDIFRTVILVIKHHKVRRNENKFTL